MKYGDPNGVVQFYADSVQPRYFDEPSDSIPSTRVAFPIRRREGSVGDIMVSLLSEVFYIFVLCGLNLNESTIHFMKSFTFIQVNLCSFEYVTFSLFITHNLAVIARFDFFLNSQRLL